MALSVVDLYRDILPKTNCGECGFPTCLAFASMVVSEKLPLERCPHLAPETVARCRLELEKQYAAGKWTKRDPAKDALQWARQRAASMKIEDLAGRIGGNLASDADGKRFLELPYFNRLLWIYPDRVTLRGGKELNRWEQVFIFNHIAQGGSSLPSGQWKSLEQIPNTISKVKSMQAHVLEPLARLFAGRAGALAEASSRLGGRLLDPKQFGADLAVVLHPLPRIPLLLLFWDQEPEDGFEARVSILFDATIVEHLDIESILFMCERLVELLEQEAFLPDFALQMPENK